MASVDFQPFSFSHPRNASAVFRAVCAIDALGTIERRDLARADTCSRIEGEEWMKYRYDCTRLQRSTYPVRANTTVHSYNNR